MNDLTTLAAVKSWVKITSDDDDALLQALIRQVSQTVLSYLNRPSVFKKQFTEKFTGSGGSIKILRNYPVISVDSVTVGQQSVPATSFWFDADDGEPPGTMQGLNLIGYSFCRAPCTVTYTSGYSISELQTAAASVFVDGPFGAWMVDGGVTYANDTPLVAVPSNPAQGQYALGNRGEYLFADADASATVLISYSYVPATLEQACLELVGERYRYRSRIGQTSQSANGATTSSYSLVDMPAYVRTALAPFRRMVPV